MQPVPVIRDDLSVDRKPQKPARRNGCRLVAVEELAATYSPRNHFRLLMGLPGMYRPSEVIEHPRGALESCEAEPSHQCDILKECVVITTTGRSSARKYRAPRL
jgi:hypothetical protein